MEIVRKDISLSEIYGENNNLLAFTLDNVLSGAECEDLITETYIQHSHWSSSYITALSLVESFMH